MSLKALQEYSFISRYAKYNKDLKRRETWNEAVSRVEQMHIERYPQAETEIRWAFDFVRQKKVLGSQRALQFGGVGIKRHEARMYNCVSSYVDRVEFFPEALYLLLCGCGVGFSVQKHHIDKLPKISRKRSNNVKTFVVPDSIEGWADALGVLMSSYLPCSKWKEWEGVDVQFDFSLVRPKGAPLSHGGKAPGPEPLKRSLNIIKGILNKALEDGQEKLRPIQAYDIVMHSSDAVLAGGIRRSATICLFSLDDQEMMEAKTGNWFIDNPQRARSNNSVVLEKGKITYEEFEKIIKNVKEFGEPGFAFVDDLEQLFNPCVEISLYGVTSYGKSGWQFCNLTEINGKKIKSLEDFKNAGRAAAIIGTLQAGYTNFTYLDPATKEITDREALLGVSITGIMDSPDIILNPAYQQEVAELIKEVNKQTAKLIGINPAARTTCVKPAGSTSCVLGTSSGIHPHHARRYIRRVQVNKMEAPGQLFQQVNPIAVEESVWSANKTDNVLSFCIEVPDGAKTKNDLSAIDLLEIVKLTQNNWVKFGRDDDLCVKPWLMHNVSNTIHIKEEEWDEVTRFIYDNRASFAGISLLPNSGDLDYPQAPFCKVSTPKEIIAKYSDGALMASGLIVDGLKEFDNNLWAACDYVNGLGDYVKTESKEDWKRRVVQFTDRYCEGSIKKCTYLMKEVNNWKLWLDLQRQVKDVDYTSLIEETDETTLSETVACAGGACQLI